MTSEARFFVKRKLHKKCGVFSACKKVTDFFDTLKNLGSTFAAEIFYSSAVLSMCCSLVFISHRAFLIAVSSSVMGSVTLT